ncbi:MAG: hypothetical protein ACYCYG_10490, partial [Bellilinea sp.]
YELLTGRLPFNSSDPSELAKMHREAVPIPPRKLNPEIPVALEQIIMKVLAKEPSSRYRTADQLGRVLSSFLQTLDSASQVSTTVRHLEYSQPNNPAQSISDQVFAVEEPSSDDDSESFNIDWGTISLALAAIVAVGGLIPFWLWIWFTFNPPTP